MSEWKNVLYVTAICVVVLIGVIFGLTKIGDTTSATTVDQNMLIEGARFIRENGETKVTVVTFSDIQCPSCKRAAELHKELETMTGVKTVMRHFPLPANIHKYALVSARAVEAGRVMGKGWEMLNIMFEKQSEWSESSKPETKFAEYAKSIGLDEKVFMEKLGSKEVAEAVQVDASLASKLQLSGTPTIFVNGQQVGADFVVAKVKEILAK